MACIRKVNTWETEFLDCDELDKPPKFCYDFWKYLLTCLISIFLHVLDIVLDCIVLYNYYLDESYTNFWCTIVFIAVPSALIASISVRMYFEDLELEENQGKKARNIFIRIILCICGFLLQLATLLRYCDILRYLCKRKSAGNEKQNYFHKKMLSENADVSVLKLFECYTETASQQVLQMSFLLVKYHSSSNSTFISQITFIILGFIGMAITMTTYNNAIRLDQDNKNNISLKGLIFQFLWHITFTVSRILILVIAGVTYPIWTCLGVFFHWCFMTIWLAITSKTKFCGESLFSEICFSGMVGLCYIFNFFSTKDGPTKKSYVMYYTLCFIESIIVVGICSTAEYIYFSKWISYTLLIISFSTFFFSLIFCIIYHTYLHPNKTKNAINNDFVS